jgi:hypothetical protein
VAMLNPPELRPSVQLLIANDLAARRGQREREDRLLATLAPRGLGGADPDRDVRVNLQSAVEIGIVRREGDDIHLASAMVAAVRKGPATAITTLRRHVLDSSRNGGAWGSQAGARDLTNALSWFLSFPAGRGPIDMEGAQRSAKELQERDFGPRQADVGDDDTGGWPIGNATRWQSFRRWACSLGFAWVTPQGILTADPTPAIRDTLSATFGKDLELAAQEFVGRLSLELPVLDGGIYRTFVEANWQRLAEDGTRLGEPLTDALERLKNSGDLSFDDRADAARVARSDGSTFSHVRLGRP